MSTILKLEHTPLRTKNSCNWNPGNTPLKIVSTSPETSITCKAAVRKLSYKRPCDGPDDSSQPPVRKSARFDEPQVLWDKCIICQSKQYVVSPNKTRCVEKLVTVSGSGISETLTAAAENLEGGEKLLFRIQNIDLVAKEAQYHKRCYSKYCKALPGDKENSPRIALSPTTCIGLFQKLVKRLESDFFKDNKVLTMKEIVGIYQDMTHGEMGHAADVRKNRLRQRLELHFGKRIMFWQPKDRVNTVMVFSNYIEKGELVEALVKLSHQCTEQAGKTGSINHTYATAKHLRHLLLGVKSNMSWPPEEYDIDFANIEVPVEVYNFLGYVLSESDQRPEAEKIVVTEKVDRQIMSITQDLIHCATKGRTKTPKHVALPLTLKGMTGSSEAVTLMNKFGHGLSYSQVLEMETAIATRELTTEELPQNCQPGFGVFVWDNIDFNEETLSGKGTSHFTNGIMVQQMVDNSVSKNSSNENEAKIPHRKRSLSLPLQKFEYFSYSGARSQPSINPEFDGILIRNNNNDQHQDTMVKDFIWLIARLHIEKTLFDATEHHSQRVPGWNAFNVKLASEKLPKQSCITYLKPIDASPTELSTVKTILHRSIQLADKLGQDDCPLVFDQAIYAKAQQLVWQDPLLYKRVVIRLGSFHTACMFLGTIGKRFADAGLSDILLESGVLGSGSLTGVLSGKHYNRALRMHKLVSEALERLRWEAFSTWLQNEDIPLMTDRKVVERVIHLQQNITDDTYRELVDMTDFQDLLERFKEYCNASEGPMKEFWSDYLDMVALLRDFLRATKEGNWALHLSCVKAMLPYVFAYDRINYSRSLTLYWAEMSVLEKTHRQTYEHFVNGNFAAQRNTRDGFSRVAMDQTIEQTLNKSCKTKGGILGVTTNKATIHKWIGSVHVRARISDRLKSIAGMTKVSTSLKEATIPRMKQDEEDVINLKDLITTWGNPYLPSQDLISIATGRMGDSSVHDDLLQAKKKGSIAFDKFLKERLIDCTVKFDEPLKTMKLRTFSAQYKEAKSHNKESMLKADRSLFARLLVVAQSRKFDMKDVLKYELSALPWSLAGVDGSLNKTAKSALHSVIEDDVVSVPVVPDVSVCIIDAMALLHRMVNVPSTFSKLAEQVLYSILNLAGQATRIDLVGDQYPKISIKSHERLRRKRDNDMVIKISSGSQSTPKQWKRYMEHSKNKIDLLSFLHREWTTDKYANRLDRVTIYITDAGECYKLSTSGDKMSSTHVVELTCDHEEADTRIILHAKHASEQGHTSILIRSADIDVEVLAIYHQSFIEAQIFLHAGTSTRPRIIKIQEILDKLGRDVCEALPGLHAITGCDSVSAFSGKGKKKALQVLRSSSHLCEGLKMLGNRQNVDDNVMAISEEFVCSLYGYTGNKINEVRYKIFCRSASLQPHHLPPTKDALAKHVQRANYQARIWKASAIAITRISQDGPHGFGWIVADDRVSINWIGQVPAPSAILQLVSCGCKGDCMSKRCSCQSNGLLCTDACRCSNSCHNIPAEIEDEASDDSSEEENQ